MCQWIILGKPVKVLRIYDKNSVAYFSDHPINVVHKTTTKRWVCWYFSSATETRTTNNPSCYMRSRYTTLRKSSCYCIDNNNKTVRGYNGGLDGKRMGRLGAFVFKRPIRFPRAYAKRMRELVMGRTTIFGRTLSALVSESDCRTPSDLSIYLFTYLFISRMPTEAEQQEEDETSRAVRTRPHEARRHP